MAEDNTGSKPASNAPATPEGKPVGEITGAEALAMMKAEKEAKAASGTAKKGDGLNAINSAIVNKAGNKQSDPTEANKEAVSDAAKEASRKLKLKNDDGTEEEIDEAEVLRIYKERKKHQSVASKELNEGRQLRKQTEKFLEMMKDKGSLMDVISKLGHDPRKLAEEYLAAQLADEMLDPKEKELREAKAKLAKIEENERKQREGVEAQRLAELKQKYAKEYETQFVDALKTSGLPANKAMVAEIAKYISQFWLIG